jgi:hypothetical protein
MIARGQERRVPPTFAQAGPSARRIGPALVTAPEPGPRHRARAPPGMPNQDRDAVRSLGRPPFRPGHAAGLAVGPRQPSGNQAPHAEPTEQGDLIMISITLNGARRKGPTGRFTCGITTNIGKWAAPAANEVAR